MLRLCQHDALKREQIARKALRPRLSRGGRLTGYGIGAIAAALLSCSALDLRLGLPTFICGVLTAAIVLAVNRQSPWPVMRQISWGVLPLVAGLFVLVEALARTGVIGDLSRSVHNVVASSVTAATWGVGVFAALASNVMNNLPIGLIAGSVVAAEHLPSQVVGTMLIGVDLGPNLSVTGSLATILWLIAIRREGLEVDIWGFLRLGVLVMMPALILSIGAMVWLSNLS